jgi:hypothetical protein
MILGRETQFGLDMLINPLNNYPLHSTALATENAKSSNASQDP